MSTTYTKENPPIVTRNGVSLPLTLTQFGKTSDRKGQAFWTLEAGAANHDKVITFMEATTADTVLSRFLRRVAMDIHVDNTDANTGVTDMDAVISDWADFTSGAATMGELEAQIGELVDQAQDIVANEDYATKEDGTPENPTRYMELTEQLKSLTNKIRPLKLTLKDIQAKHAAAAVKRAAAKAAKEASSPSKSA